MLFDKMEIPKHIQIVNINLTASAPLIPTKFTEQETVKQKSHFP